MNEVEAKALRNGMAKLKSAGKRLHRGRYSRLHRRLDQLEKVLAKATAAGKAADGVKPSK